MLCSAVSEPEVTPVWLLEGVTGLSALARCRSASDRARLLLVSSFLGTDAAGLEPGVIWGAATPGIAAAACCLSLFWPGNVS